MLEKDLFARLAEGHAAGITVVTPNRRLAHELTLGFDAFQKDLKSWEAADILPFSAFVARLWEDALYSDQGEKLPLLLTEAQEQLLWERILAKSGLLVVPQAAAQCREAWRLVHQWRIPAGSGNEDAAAFSRWAAAYKKHTEGETDAARLPDLMAQCEVRKPKLLVAYAFDLIPPQTREFFQGFETAECRPDPLSSTPVRTSFPSAKLELEAAASWARARLEEGKKRIGVVVPELGRRRREAARVFSRVMQPGYNLPGAPRAAMPFNLSLGEPLSAYPLVDAALSLLELGFVPVEFSKASSLIRSPFLGGADSEMAKRAQLDARLRRDADATITLGKLVALAEPAPLLRKYLEAAFEIAKTKADSAAEWARQFSAVLDAAGFPGERALDSEEFQARAKWHEALGELARLERLSKGMSFDEAHARLRHHCDETLFQPESADAPIQVLGVLESAGLRFDALWVGGLTDQAWPLPARPNPFIPVALQRAAGIPQSSAESTLASAKELMRQWAQSAGEVVYSHPEKEEDRDLAPSALISSFEKTPVAMPAYPRYRDLIFSSRKMESFEDAKAPPVAPGKVRGGVKVLADQAACPFRAFARWRLGAQALEEPGEGLDPRDRGKLLHALMREIWTRIKSSEDLKRDLALVISQSAAAAVGELGLEGRFAELERERLAKLAREWLGKEAERAAFEVVSVEDERTINLAGLAFSSRIDRMDRLQGGGHVLIDYKSGNPNLRHWEGPRPDDPQLPLYAVSAPEELAAVAFARLRTGEMRFIGYSRAGHAVPGVQARPDWTALLARWKKDAEALATGFASGDAHVDPKEDFKTCRLCELQTLCRVYEKKNPLEEA